MSDHLTLARPRASAGVLGRPARRVFFKALSRLEHGLVRVRCGDEEHVFGRHGPDFPGDISVHVSDPGFYRRVLLGGTLAAGEAYMRGEWSCDDPAALFRLLLRDRDALSGLDPAFSRLSEPLQRLWHRLRRNTRAGARRNIAAHYDLGNDFFSLFLDPTLTYSCGVFESADATLEQASRAKYERICRKLALAPEHHVLEIGTGWGGFALHAAREHGCQVTTTTISREQYELATKRIETAGLSGRVRVLLEDYRDLTGVYDRLVSIEMIEAVGHQFFDVYFRSCSDRLKPDGSLALQAITIPDREYERALHTVDFIKRYIFPGGTLPSLGRIGDSIARCTDLRLSHLEDLSPHYAETLRRWRAGLNANRDSIRALGYSDEFLRMWEYYLSSCEASFDERHTGSVQMIFDKPLVRRPPVLGELPSAAAR